ADGIGVALDQEHLARVAREGFLIGGHTDAVGSDVDNLSLSDRRAEAVAELLTSQFQVPAENLTSQGYGEQYLKVPTQEPERL
ncbi:OmpA family protein, partial [Klebsiella pneumoniae]|uniref:OmpA family protein n=1 Tax=Klebsiella pneumoniae TaxID=573 RepID=UPI003F51EECE